MSELQSYRSTSVNIEDSSETSSPSARSSQSESAKSTQGTLLPTQQEAYAQYCTKNGIRQLNPWYLGPQQLNPAHHPSSVDIKVFRPRMSVRVEPFAGACDGSIDSFIKRVEFQVKYSMASVEEDEKVQAELWALTDHLKDNARVFYDGLPYATKNDFKKLTDALRKKYSAREDLEEQDNLFLKIGRLKQDGQPLDGYLDVARGLFDKCASDEGTRAYTIRKTLEGLSNASVRTQVMLMTKSYTMFGNAEVLPPSFEDVALLITTAEQGFSPHASGELAVVHKPSAAERQKLATHELWLNSQRESEKRSVQAHQETTRELVKGLSETFGPLLRTMEANGQLQGNRSTLERPRVTYPVGQIITSESQQQGPLSYSGQPRRTPENSPCLNCYGMGHFRANCPEAGKIGPKARLDERLKFIAKHGEDALPRMSPRPATVATSAAGLAPIAASAIVDRLEDEIQDGEILCIDSLSERMLSVDDVMDAIKMGSPEWRDLPEEVVTALLGEEDLNTEDEEFIYDEIMATNNKRTRVDAGISTDEHAGGEPQRRSQPVSKPRRTQKRGTPAVGGKNNLRHHAKFTLDKVSRVDGSPRKYKRNQCQTRGTGGKSGAKTLVIDKSEVFNPFLPGLHPLNAQYSLMMAISNEYEDAKDFGMKRASPKFASIKESAVSLINRCIMIERWANQEREKLSLYISGKQSGILRQKTIMSAQKKRIADITEWCDQQGLKLPDELTGEIASPKTTKRYAIALEDKRLSENRPKPPAGAGQVKTPKGRAAPRKRKKSAPKTKETTTAEDGLVEDGDDAMQPRPAKKARTARSTPAGKAKKKTTTKPSEKKNSGGDRVKNPSITDDDGDETDEGIDRLAMAKAAVRAKKEAALKVAAITTEPPP